MAVTVPDVPTEFAAEGTALHDVTAKVLSGGAKPGIGSTLRADGFEFAYTVDRDALVDWCVERVGELRAQLGGAELHVEVRLPLPFIEPGSFGTSDVIILSYETRTLYVLDHKFGAGVKVHAAENPQLIAYALGALFRYSVLDEFDRIVFGVLQPKLNHHDVAELTIAQAEDWAGRFREAARATHSPDAPLVAGDHCRFCPVKPTCPELHTQALAAAQAIYAEPSVPEPYSLPADRIALVLSKAPMIRAYIEAVEQEARRRLQVGLEVPGWKIVAGRGGNREWVDTAKLREWAHSLVDMGFLDKYEDVHDAPSFLSPAQMEKLCKRTGVVFPAYLVTRATGAPAVVPASDTRPSLAAAFEAIP